MKVTWSWLSDWTALPGSPEALAQILAMRGLPVQSLERGAAFDPMIVVGRVLTADPHPNADRLRLCTVDVGGPSRLSIVCGASNVAAGQRVAVAQVGATLPDGTKLRKAKIRGVESQGMICSERELGLSEESEGIWVLPGEPAVGRPLQEIAGSSDTVLDVEITSNRADCVSVRGLAREIASSLGAALREPEPLHAAGSGTLPRVVVEQPADCARYMARLVTGLSIGPSPAWLQRRLEATGFRCINNVVDATNYVLREYGQPIHAFDAARIGGNEIRVRRARPGERLTLLDDRDVALHEGVQVIADRSRPMALAGIMGGRDTGVSAATQSVVLESAFFDPRLTRSAAASLGIQTDASIRFVQGVDPVAVALALDATARLLAEIAGGTVAAPVVDEWPGRGEPAVIRLRLGRLARLLGMAVEPAAATRALASLGIEQAGGWGGEPSEAEGRFRVPPHRHDLSIEEDLIEEVARVVGYDAIPTTLLPTAIAPAADPPETDITRRVVDLATGLGFHEAISHVLVGTIPPEVRDGVADGEIWELQNPKSRELRHLRTSLLPDLLECAARNLHVGVGDVRLAEVGKVFRAVPPPLGSERLEAALVLAGTPEAWDRPGAEPDRYLELRGAVEAMLQALGIDGWRTGSYHEACFRRGSGAELRAPAGVLGRMGEVAPSLARPLGFTQPVWAAVLDVAAIVGNMPSGRRYREVPRYPASKRDLAVIVRSGVTHEDLLATIRGAGGTLLDAAWLFDVYAFREGEHAGLRSMAYALEFRSPERTLTDREVDEGIAAIVRALESERGARIRGAAEGSRV
ncbi:MAG TPA: phenylalanine--tRNA ligase subunit beta [Candidatus Eisenbacteria bacterium]